MVDAVRKDRVVGHGTCSMVDECLSDTELAESLVFEGISTPEAAIKYARGRQAQYLERALNCRFGENNDPELLAWNEFKKACAE